MNWTIKLNREVLQYLIALREDGTELRIAVEQLKQNPLEDSVRIQEQPHTRERFAAEHWITYVIEDKDTRWLSITGIEPVAPPYES